MMSDHDENEKTIDEYEYHGDDYTTADFKNDTALKSRIKFSRNRRILIMVGVVVLAGLGVKLWHTFKSHHIKQSNSAAAFKLKTGGKKSVSPFAIPKQGKPVNKAGMAPVPINNVKSVPAFQASAPAPATALSSSRGITTRQFKQLQTQNANLSDQLSQLSNSSTALNQQVDTLSATLSAMSEQVRYLTQVQQQEALKAKAAKVHAHNAKVKKRHAEVKRWTAKPKYYIEALIPGRAWLKSVDGETITAQVGDTLPVYGRILTIDVKRGVLTTSSGKIVRYAESSR